MEVKNHFKYTNYGADKDGNVYNTQTNKIKKQATDKFGYKYTTVRYEDKTLTVRLGRFIYECFNGAIDDNLVIDHINNEKGDNRIENLQLITQSSNVIKKYTEGYDQHDARRKRVLCTDVLTNTETIYKSIYGAGKVLNIVPASIQRVCKGIQKTAISKTDQKRYNFKII